MLYVYFSYMCVCVLCACLVSTESSLDLKLLTVVSFHVDAGDQ